MSDVDRVALGALLSRLESDAHRHGWDAPPALHVLYDADDQATAAWYRSTLDCYGPAMRVGPYAARVAGPSVALEPNAAHNVFRMALNLRAPDAETEHAVVLAMLRQPGLVGVAMRYEAWGHEYATEAEARSLRDRPLADTVGSYEVRHVDAVDLGGRRYSVHRQRGRKPVTFDSDDEGAVLEGSIMESLHVTLAVLAGLDRPELVNVPYRFDFGGQVTRP